jgi:hypothetical protein
MTTRLLATGTTLLGVGLALAAVVAEWFAAFGAASIAEFVRLRTRARP